MQPALSRQRRRRLACLLSMPLACAGSSPAPSGSGRAEPIFQLAGVWFGTAVQEGKLVDRA